MGIGTIDRLCVASLFIAGFCSLKKLHVYILASVLTAVGAAFFFYKHYVLSFPLSPDQSLSLWAVEAHVSFVSGNQPVKVELFIPRSTRQLVIRDEYFISRGFGLTTQTVDVNRQAIWSVRRSPGRHGLYYRAIVGPGGGEMLQEPVRVKVVPPVEEELEGARLEAVNALLAVARQQSADIGGLVTALIAELNRPDPDSGLSLLLGRRVTVERKAEIAMLVLRQASVRARLVRGIRLNEPQRRAPLIPRLEVHDNNSWLSFDLSDGSSSSPDDFLPWWRGEESIVDLEGGWGLQTAISIDRYEEDAVTGAVSRGQVTSPRLLEFSLFSLPLETQRVFRILLLVPIGALLVVLLRNIVGVKTFGTFMPVLIALAFRENDLQVGVIFFCLLVVLGLVARFYLEHLKLILVPRLAAVLTIVVMLMVLVSIISNRLGIEAGISIALFPMVILTMTIERMSIIWEEVGALESIKQGVGSLMAAIIVYFVTSIKLLQHLVFVFPELLLIILAIILLLGRYTGYRLTELTRFRRLAKGEL